MDSYTPDAICRILGLAGFVDDRDLANADAAIRLLACPSFHMEVCITIVGLQQVSAVSVVAAQKHIWTYRDPSLVNPIKGEGKANADFQSLIELFNAAKDAPERKGIALDGMPVHIGLWTQGKVQTVNGNPEPSSALGAVVEAIINRAFSSIDSQMCHNALADVASYVGLTLPRQETATAPDRLKIGILGVPEEQSELLSAFEVVKREKQ